MASKFQHLYDEFDRTMNSINPTKAYLEGIRQHIERERAGRARLLEHCEQEFAKTMAKFPDAVGTASAPLAFSMLGWDQEGGDPRPGLRADVRELDAFLAKFEAAWARAGREDD